MINSKKVNRMIEETLERSTKIIADLHNLSDEINKTANLIVTAINKNKKIIIIGNGGSAADAQHIAAEFLGRYKLERKSIPAIALTSNSSTTTAIANDYDFNDIFVMLRNLGFQLFTFSEKNISVIKSNFNSKSQDILAVKDLEGFLARTKYTLVK